MTATTVAELAELVELIEQDRDLNAVVFDSANPDFFLAHYDTEGDPAKTVSLPPGPTGMHPWLDLTARLSRAPVVSIASIRDAPAGPAASSPWPVTSAWPGTGRSSHSSRSAPGSSPGEARWRACRG